jgi:2-amino-4-hydroxy-6-hydroxymethyldihydropteridine diphosphokinase
MLRKTTRVVEISTCWETAAFGGSGPNFINLAVSIQTNQDVNVLKSGIIRQIENELGRVRTTDKNAARTIDLDIILFDGQVVEPALWERAYLALTVAELFPNLQEVASGRFLPAIAAELAVMQPAVIRPGFLNPTG